MYLCAVWCWYIVDFELENLQVAKKWEKGSHSVKKAQHAFYDSKKQHSSATAKLALNQDPNAV